VGSLFSQISGKFSKSLVFGCFFPVVFFVLLDWILFAPYVPAATGVVKTLKALDDGWQTLAMGGLTVLFSGLLYILNTPIIRFYEGYPWEHSLIGGVLKRREQQRWERMHIWAAGLRAAGLAGGEDDEAASEDLHTVADTLERDLGTVLPIEKSSVLPTRLGNVIRSFEDYPSRQYGMAAITLWPRLVAVIDSGYATAMDDARSSFDFMINASFLSGVSAAVLLLLGLGSPEQPRIGAPEWWLWILQFAALALLAMVFYRGSIGQAQSWGNMVRSAFDLYRSKLLEQLGFDQKPASLAEERQLWKAISHQMVYGDPPSYSGMPLLRFESGGTFAVGYPATLPLTVSRSVQEVAGGWQTCLAVHNPGDRAVEEVRVTDTLPNGTHYVWNSALSGGRVLPVSGSNPITIELGGLAAEEQRIVVYRTHE
jgi:hypothetical protein